MRRKRVYIRANADLVKCVKEQAQEVNRTISNFIKYVLNFIIGKEKLRMKRKKSCASVYLQLLNVITKKRERVQKNVFTKKVMYLFIR